MTLNSIEKELEEALNLEAPEIRREVRFQGDNRSAIIDLVLEDPNTVCYVEIKRRLTPDIVARFYVAKELIMQSPPSKENIFIIGAQIIDPIFKKMANQLGIRVERITVSVSDIRTLASNEPSKIKVTAKKAWKTIVSLLEYQPSSIYNLMKKSGVSYGQAHKIVSYLRSRDLLTQKGNFVSISDFRPILNAVFWERPLKSLIVEHYNINIESFEDMPREISNMLDSNNILHAFTGFTAYEKYFGSIRRGAPYELYADVNNPLFHQIIRETSSIIDQPPNLIIYQPDRDVFSDAESVDKIPLVSKGQLLLDLSGGDKIAIQLATEMVKRIGKI